MTQVAFCQYVLPNRSCSKSNIDVLFQFKLDYVFIVYLIKTIVNIFHKYLCIGIDLMGLLAAISLFVVLGQNILRFQAQCNLFSPTQRATLSRNRSKMDSSQVQDGLLKICLQMPIPESVKCHYHVNLVSASF